MRSWWVYREACADNVRSFERPRQALVSGSPDVFYGNLLAISYRPEIDGLRTVAVVAVIVYHAEFEFAGRSVLPGGFFGVDVFFVISGFLITSLITAELHTTGRFSLLNFYERRIRRLLPALLLVMLCSCIAAWYVLLPRPLVDFSRSLVASLFFLSNFYWDMSLQQYGAESAQYKPLLHTWSLAVEEQYYLVFPMLLLLVNRWRHSQLQYFFIGGILLSLLFALWFSTVDPNTSFYMLPSRFWELLAGGLLASGVLQQAQKLQPTVMSRTLSALGIFLVLLSFVIATKDEHAPGLLTLLPVVGTALVIRYADARDWLTRVLSSRLFIAIGLLSYSLYLWHFPIFAFARNLSAHLSDSQKLLCIALTFALSVLGYFLVEKPCRNRAGMPTRRLLIGLVTASLLVLSFSGYSMLKHGVRSRFAALEALYGINEFDNTILRKESWSILGDMASAQGHEKSNHAYPTAFETGVLWFSADRQTEKVLIIGNSPSKDLFNAFVLNSAAFPDYEFARFAMHPRDVASQAPLLWKAPNFINADVVIVRFLVREDWLGPVEQFIEQLEATGKQIYLWSSPPAFTSMGKTPLFDWYLQEHGTVDEPEGALDRLFFERRLPRSATVVDTRLRQLAQRLGIPYRDGMELVCRLEEQTCAGMTSDGYKAYYDNIHWTLEGARYFGTRLSAPRVL